MAYRRFSRYAMQEIIRKGQEDAFLVFDMKDISDKFHAWNHHLPRVEPFYAVKCNDDDMILNKMVGLGMSFDCASRGEIQKVISLGADPSSIVYANPCKQVSHLRFARDMGVDLMTFDNENELHKIKSVHPDSKLLLRLLPDDSKSVCRLGNKFGAELSQVESLLSLSKNLGLNVCGVSYHVGSGCYDPSSFTDAIYLARSAFDIGEEMGMDFSILDIGGGYPGDAVSDWDQVDCPDNRSDDPQPLMFPLIAKKIDETLEDLFPEREGVRIIAEPGRYFVHSCATLATSIIAKRNMMPSDARTVSGLESCEEGKTMYYINEGVYGTFNNIIYDHANVAPWCNVLPTAEGEEHLYKKPRPVLSSIWGPSCDGLDCVVPELHLPDLEVGSWLYFENMGAYTSCAASSFNGFELPSKVYLPDDEGEEMEEAAYSYC